MRRDPIVTATLDTADAWEREATDRERRAPGVPDPVAATLKSNASELRMRIEQIERDTAYLTVAQYAEANGTSESTVRRLCARGLIEDAVRDVGGDWRIPRGAKRMAQPNPEAGNAGRVAVAS